MEVKINGSSFEVKKGLTFRQLEEVLGMEEEGRSTNQIRKSLEAMRKCLHYCINIKDEEIDNSPFKELATAYMEIIRFSSELPLSSYSPLKVSTTDPLTP